MRARIPVPQSRRGLLVTAVALVIVLGAAAGVILASGGSTKADERGLVAARFPGYQLAFRYPAAWHRQDWCWLSTTVFPLTLLTTVNPPPSCQSTAMFGLGTPLPPEQVLGKDGVAVWWLTTSRSILDGVKPNASVDGAPANISVRQEPTRNPHPPVSCAGSGTTQRLLTARIKGPSPTVAGIRVGAVICGPHFASGLADVRDMLASVRFTG